MRVPALFPLFLILFAGLEAHAADWRGGKVVSVVWNADPEFKDEWGDVMTRLEITLEDSQFDKATYYHFANISATMPADVIFATAKEAMIHDKWLWISVNKELGIVAVALTPPNTTAVRESARPVQGRGSRDRQAAGFRIAGAGAIGAVRNLLGRALPAQPDASAR